MNPYKIKVGIEEYPVLETDIPRIVQAMKTNDMVKLDCGVFRGSAILAVCEVIPRIAFGDTPPTVDELRESARQKALEDKRSAQIKACTLCRNGWQIVKVGNDSLARPCTCRQLKDVDLTNTP